VLDDGYQKFLAWGSLILFIWVPVIAIVTWIIRRITGKKGRSGIIRLTFLSLWILGLICFVNLVVSLSNEFRYRNYPVEQTVSLANPAVNKLEIKTAPFGRYWSGSWLHLEPFAAFDEDTVYVKNIRLRIVKGDSGNFKVTIVKMANGRTKSAAENIANTINYNVAQKDTMLLLDKGIAITRQEKFRNQQVIITVAVPVGKRIYINDNVGWDNNVHVDLGRHDDYWDWENSMETESLRWRHNVEYIMTEKGLERVDKQVKDEDEDNNSNQTIEEFRKSRDEMEREKQEKLRELQEIDKELKKTDDSTRYHYQQPDAPANPPARKTKSTPINKATAMVSSTPFGIHDPLLLTIAF
jgi:hypothetical protein